LGAVNGLLPCGLVYAALAIALTNGGPFDAAVFMASFGIGTTPAVFGAWLLGGWRPLAVRRIGAYVAPAALTIAAVLLIARALAMPTGHAH
jgi:sulfite exporter TauE/SafE